MKQYTPQARVWIIAVIAAAAVVSGITVHSGPPPSRTWLACALLGFCAAIAHFFPIHSPSNQASFRLTNVFIIAGAVILPACLLIVLILIAIAPEGWRDRRRTAGLVRTLFNASHAILAAQAAAAVIAARYVKPMDTPVDVIAVGLAIAAFVAVQNLIVATGMALHFRRAIWRTEVLGRTALTTDLLFGLFGAIVAVLWQASPWSLVCIAPMLLIIYRLTRNAHLADMARIDPKTGLANARHFEQLLDEAINRGRQLGRPLAVLFLDIDHFKVINDAHGHAAGDAVLRDVAHTVAATLRKKDLLARFGGEEFVALLPDVTPELARLIAEDLRGSIESHPFMLKDDTVVRCTVSIGIAISPDDGDSATAVLIRADEAMYRAKVTRNAVWSHASASDYSRVAEPSPGPANADDGRSDPATPSARRSNIHVPRPSRMDFILWGTIISGACAATMSLTAVWHTHQWLTLLPLMALAAGCEFFPVQLYQAKREKVTITLTETVVMAAVAIEPFIAPLVQIGAALVHVAQGRQRRIDKLLFNLTNPAFAAGCAAGCYLALRPPHGGFTAGNVIAAFISAVVFTLANSGVIALMISLHSRRPLLRVARELIWYAPLTILLGMTGAFLGTMYHQLGVAGTAMVLVPVIAIRFTLGFAAQKNREAIAALEETNVRLKRADEEKTKTLTQLIETISNIIDARDNFVWGHSRKVADYSQLIAVECGLTGEALAAVHSAGLLHDLGKVAVPETILHKPGRLTDEEYATVKQHPVTGKRILADMELLSDVARMVGEHHERYDGGGYPHGKARDEISTGGRILAVADALDSMLSDRVYSTSRSLADALAEIDRCAGTQFDPAVVAALHRVIAAKGEEYFCNSVPEVTALHPDERSAQIIAFPRVRAS